MISRTTSSMGRAAGLPRQWSNAVAERLLCFAAAPSFAIMALLTGLNASAMERLCYSGHAAPLSGMAAMYWLMSAFHSAPWLNLILGRRQGPSAL